MIRYSKPGWTLPINSEFEQETTLGDLRAGLLTTYDPPDPWVLMEDYLPRWLNLNREMGDDTANRDLFYMELQQKLHALRGRITIFCSPRIEEEKSHWLWKNVHLCFVGRNQRAVQHGKLWLLHRGGAGEKSAETLEIQVGSTNLTRAALHGQIQAGWRAILRLSTPSRSRYQSWGVLPGFLKELRKQSGENSRQAVEYWIKEIFPRAACPEGVNFIASVPGRHGSSVLRKRNSAWGLSGLRKLGRRTPTRKIQIFVPTVGRFNKTTLETWAREAGTQVSRVNLAWISENHPWKSDWQMPKETSAQLRKAGGLLREVPNFPKEKKSIIKDHLPDDPRWFHGKLYWIRDGKRCQLLITSANWSSAAWGSSWQRGGLSIENFELGVAFPCDWKWVDKLKPFEDPYAKSLSDRELEPSLAWGEATWNGKVISICARISNTNARLDPMVRVGRGDRKSVTMKAQWKGGDGKELKVRLLWPKSFGIPGSVSLSIWQGTETVERTLPVCDIRKPDGLTTEHYDEISANRRAELELGILEERYGGASADRGPARKGRVGKGGSEKEQGGSNGYEVHAISLAREKFDIVSRLAEALRKIHDTDRHGHLTIKNDGNRMLMLWNQILKILEQDEATAFRLAAEELRCRLKAIR